MSASFLVSLTVIPILCSLLLKPKPGRVHKDGIIIRSLKWALKNTWLRLALSYPIAVMPIGAVLLSGTLSLYPTMGKDFLPSFNEETALVALTAAPGTSLEQMNEISDVADRLLLPLARLLALAALALLPRALALLLAREREREHEHEHERERERERERRRARPRSRRPRRRFRPRDASEAVS